MLKIGKWIGLALGIAFGGFIGGVLGFALGAIFDSMESGQHQYKATHYNDFIYNLLVLSAAVMKADGKLLKSELEYVKVFLIRQFGVEETKERMLVFRDIIKSSELSISDSCQKIKIFLRYQDRLQIIHFLFGLSASDGIFDPLEVKMIEDIAFYLDIESNDYQSLKAMFIKDTTSAYKILEISPDVSDEEVKKAYRRMAKKYHPDKVGQLGDEILKAANEKFQQLNNAYEEIKRQRGMS